MKVRNLESLSALRYSVFYNVLHIYNVQAIPTYRDYRLYDIVLPKRANTWTVPYNLMLMQKRHGWADNYDLNKFCRLGRVHY